jgi:hypothetical protein
MSISELSLIRACINGKPRMHTLFCCNAGMAKLKKPVGRPPKDEARMPLTPLQQIVSDNMAKLLEKKTQAEVARPSGRGKGPAQSSVSRWKAGSVNPNVKTLEGLASAHGFPAWMLLFPGFDPEDPPIAASSGRLSAAATLMDTFLRGKNASDYAGGVDSGTSDSEGPRGAGVTDIATKRKRTEPT